MVNFPQQTSMSAWQTMEDVMVGAPIQLALSYVIVISNMDLNWDKMDALVWVRAHSYMLLLNISRFVYSIYFIPLV